MPAPTLFGLPLNQIVAFFGPVVAIIAGAAASWLGTHFPGLHINTSKAAGDIAEAIEFLIGAGVTLLLHSKWLDGWQKWEAAVLTPMQAALNAPASSNGSAATSDTPDPLTVLASALQRASGGSSFGQGKLSDG